ncbi:MAG: helix-turn-helix domain-containing protein [Euryarchaeota archaeon]|nr:helix-turn-helix domain-containing protein [Euryarchaeota archaeon]MBU4491450.1 helix-turn-helix domain-containing protein [Euryarchaeota archaeon]MCG2727361.1 helix-turn-helix domain-containing protein [Candidatus Methanoperedenaceae archaeon]
MPENEKDPGDEKLLILPLGEESKKITQVISNDTARQIIELLADAPLSASDIADRLHAPLTTIIYNLENLESVGLVKVERIKYSEKGREVKIYAPVRKLIVVVPEKTDKKSVADVLRKYLGVILAAVLASSLIEFFMRSAGRSAKTMQITSDSIDSISVPPPGVPPMPAITSTPVRMVNETIKGGDVSGIVPTPVATPMVPPVPTAEVQSIPAATSTPTVPAPAPVGAWSANATATPVPVQPSALDSGAASQAAPDIFTNIANMIAAHPGLVFFMGCLFVIAIFVVVEYRKRK